MVNRKFSVVCYGEILWDVLPSGAKPGGAPMNVAYHLQKMGIHTGLITRIGKDQWGKDLLTLMFDQGIDTSFFQIDEQYTTGVVNAKIGADNEVTYDIVKPVAWDRIMYQNGMGTIVSNADYFVFGSLASRSEVSRNTLFQLIDKSNYRVLDINLRAPHFTRDILEQLLTKANLLKLNESELALIGSWYTSSNLEKDKINAVQDKFSIDRIIVTKGAQGALLKCQTEFYSHPGIKITVADTVGSGDSFLAAFLTCMINGDNPQQSLEFACSVGALIATYAGACPDYNPNEINKLLPTS